MDRPLTVHQQDNFVFSSLLSLSVFRLNSYMPPSLHAHLPPSSLFLYLFSFILRSKSQLCTHPHTSTFTHTHALAFSSIEWLYCHFCLAGTISPKQFMKWQFSNTDKYFIHLFTGGLFGLKTWTIHLYTINNSDNNQSCNWQLLILSIYLTIIYKWINHSLLLSMNDEAQVQ